MIFTHSAEQADDRLAAAIRRAQANLLRLQHADGHWCGELFVDSTLCADYIAYMHWGNAVDRVLEGKCAAHVRRRQLADGGWNLYEGGPSDINASVKAYFALKLAGHSPTQPYMHEARACILRLGGIPRMNTYAKLYLALLGQFPWKYLPTVPAEMIFFPRWCFFNVHELSSWSRAMLMPLAILNHYKPTRQLPPEQQLHELYPAGTEQSDLGLGWEQAAVVVAKFLPRLRPRVEAAAQAALETVARARLETVRTVDGCAHGGE